METADCGCVEGLACVVGDGMACFGDDGLVTVGRCPLSIAGAPPLVEPTTGLTIITLLRELGGSPISVPRIGGLRELLVDGLGPISVPRVGGLREPWVTVGEDVQAADHGCPRGLA